MLRLLDPSLREGRQASRQLSDASTPCCCRIILVLMTICMVHQQSSGFHFNNNSNNNIYSGSRDDYEIMMIANKWVTGGFRRIRVHWWCSYWSIHGLCYFSDDVTVVQHRGFTAWLARWCVWQSWTKHSWFSRAIGHTFYNHTTCHIIFAVQPQVLFWFGDRKGIWPVRKVGCWFVGGDDMTGALHVL